MKPGAQIVVAAAARTYTPLIVLLALSVLAARAPGEGFGFIAGLAFIAAFALHALVFGAAASRAALPPWLMRAALALGLVIAVAGAFAPHLAEIARAAEAGLCIVTASGGALILNTLIGRAPTMSDEAW
jgi:multisubunit Na+/H+ antiporter MnhB subunit